MVARIGSREAGIAVADDPPGPERPFAPDTVRGTRLRKLTLRHVGLVDILKHDHLEGSMSESECCCGCGETTRGERFRPGHDQKLRKAIEEAVGGLESLRAIAEAHVKRPITTRDPD